MAHGVLYYAPGTGYTWEQPAFAQTETREEAEALREALERYRWNVDTYEFDPDEE